MLSNVFIMFVAAFETTAVSITCTLLAITLEQYSQDALVKARRHAYAILGRSCRSRMGVVGGGNMHRPQVVQTYVAAMTVHLSTTEVELRLHDCPSSVHVDILRSHHHLCALAAVQLVLMVGYAAGAR